MVKSIPRVLQGEEGPGDGAGDAAEDPVEVVEEADAEHEVALDGAVVLPVADQKRVGLVGQSEDEVELPPAVAAELFDERDAVDAVADVDEQREQRDFEERGRAAEDVHSGELEAAGEDGHAHQERPRRTVSGLSEQDAEGGSHRGVAHQHRERGDEGRFCSFPIHKSVALPETRALIRMSS